MSALPLAQLLVRYTQGREGLLKLLDGPVLLFEPVEEAPLPDDDDHHFMTVSGLRPLVPTATEPEVFPLRKRTDNAFQRGITVGRTANNDLVIDSPSISRFHAWFVNDDGVWSVADADSKNGTQVNGKELKPKKPTALGDEAVIEFGHVKVRFFSRDAFLKFLAVRAKR